MIGIRPLLSAGTVAAVVTVGLGGGAPRPEIELGTRHLVAQRAERAAELVAALEAELAPAVELARDGAARVIAGDAAPGPRLLEAAEHIGAAEGAAADARRAVLALERARRTWAPRADPLASAMDPGELGSISAQMEATIEAADDFAVMRARAAEVTVSLDRALAALDAGDVAAAETHVATARSDHGALAAWEVGIVTLPIWVETVDEMIRAVEQIVSAVQRGDHEGAAEAADAFAAIAGDGATADRALRIAIGEGGSAVVAAPLGRLASVLSSIAELRSDLASVQQAVEP